MNPYDLAQYNYWLSDRDRFILHALNGSQRNSFAESNQEWAREYAKRKYAKQRKVFVE